MKYYGFAIAWELSQLIEHDIINEDNIKFYIKKYLANHRNIEEQQTVLDRMEEILPQYKNIINEYRILI